MFGLDPESVLARVKASGKEPSVPCLGSSLLRGTLGFTVVSLGGFAPWVIGIGHWLHSEVPMFVACAAMFIGLSGWLLHGLIIGPGSLSRFYKLFGFAFAAYSFGWTPSWILLHGNLGNTAGLVVGSAFMGFIFAIAFGNPGAALKAIPVLCAGSLAGIYVGDWAHQMVLEHPQLIADRATRVHVSQTVWGLIYGLGFGPGIGAAFYFCQSEVRRKLAETA